MPTAELENAVIGSSPHSVEPDRVLGALHRAKAQAISRMPTARRIATLVAFVHCLEATAQDEVLEVLEMLLDDLFGKAITADQKARLRTLKDLDQSAAALAEACHLLLDPAGRKPAQESVRENSTSSTGKRS